MHKSRLAGFIIDCENTDSEVGAAFWSQALGMPSKGKAGANYSQLDAGARDLHVEVQTVTHESRVHLDIETDNVEKEVQRLEKLGATVVEKKTNFYVMKAPTGQRFCVVRAQNLSASHFSEWT